MRRIVPPCCTALFVVFALGTSLVNPLAASSSAPLLALHEQAALVAMAAAPDDAPAATLTSPPSSDEHSHEPLCAAEDSDNLQDDDDDDDGNELSTTPDSQLYVSLRSRAAPRPAHASPPALQLQRGLERPPRV